MNSYLLRAMGYDDNIHTFSLKDVPVFLNSETILLANVPNSPLLMNAMVTRSAEYNGLFEGDILQCNGCEYVITYSNGFIATSERGKGQILHQLKDYEVIGNVYTCDKYHNYMKKGSQLLYKYRDVSIRLTEILGSYSGRILAQCCKGKISATEIQQATYFSHQGTRQYFGDLIDGYPIELYNGRIVTNKGANYYDVIRKEIL